MNFGGISLGVNIDHVATLRQARGTRYPDPVYAALMAEQAGAEGSLGLARCVERSNFTPCSP